jgi:hypothetical protein
MKRLLTLILFLVPVAFAQGFVVSPQAIVVNPRPSFGVEVWLDRDSSGDATPAYQIGEEVSISVRPAEASYVYLFDVKSTGEITQIFPNRFDTDNYLRAGETRTFPPSGARYVFNIAPPRGLSKVIAVASKTELDTRTLASFRSESDMFPQSTIGESGFIESFAIIVRPVPQQDWVTDTALYYVGNRPQQAEFGTLRFTSTPSGADVYLDGEFIGYTPLRFGTRPGTHRVRVELDGYEPFSTTVNLRGGEVLDVNARLQAQARPGTVAFTSSPSGADVYVDGRYVGTTPTGAIRFDDGTYTARFELPGYQTTTVTFRARAGENRSVAASMQAQLGSILVQGNVGGALVFVDGRQVGTLASGSGRFELRDVSSGMHEVVVMAPGYATYVTTVNVQPGRTSEVNVRQSRF